MKHLLACAIWMMSAVMALGTARQQVDSLLQLLPASTDTSRAGLYNLISWSYYSINTDSLYHYAEEGLKLSQEHDYHTGIATAYSLIGIHAEVVGNTHKALEYQLKALEVRKKHGTKAALARSYNSVGVAYDYIGNYAKAFEYYKKGLDLKIEIGDKEGMVGSYDNIGLLLNDLGSYNEALENFFKSMEIIKELKIDEELGQTYNYIGIIFYSQKNYEKSIEYYRKAVELQEKYERTIELSYTYSNLAEALEKVQHYDEALDFHQKALDIRIKLDDKRGLAFSYHMLGVLQYNRSKFDEALDYFEKCAEIRESLNDQRGAAIVLAEIGRVYNQKNELSKAQAYLERALEYENTEDPSFVALETIYDILSQVYQKQGKYKQAYDFHVKFMNTKDSLFNTEKANNISQMEMQFRIKSEREADSLKHIEKEKRRALQLAEKEKRDRIKQEKKDAELARQKTFAYAGIILAIVMMGLAFVLFRGYRQKQKDNLVITAQKAEVEEQREIVTEKNREITDSIAYAKRLQDAILPSEKEISNNLGESFILFKPKDIVSGDFYWLEVKNNTVLYAAVDCTGHGVPGAMVSVVGHNGLDRCVKEFDLTQPSAILDKLSELVEETFDNADTDEVKDGMDIALCSLSGQSLSFAGANNPIYIVRQKGEKGLRANNVQVIPSNNNEHHILYEVKGDRQPIGNFDNRQAFTNQQIELNKGDTLYIFSDGYADQFGGPRGKKFKYSEFKKILLDIQSNPMHEQQQILDQTIELWRGDIEQVDDICIIGVRV